MNELDEMKRSIQRIETAVCGDDEAGIEGLAKQVRRHENILNGYTKFVWMVSGAGVVVGLIIKIVWK